MAMRQDLDYELVRLNENLPVRYFYSNDKKATNVTPHYHSEVEIIYLLSGLLNVTKGIEHFTIHPEDIVVFNANEIHSTNAPNTYTTAYVLQISHSFLNLILNNGKTAHYSIPRPSSTLVSPETEQDLSMLKTKIREFFSFEANCDMFGYIHLQAILCDIIYQLQTSFLDMTVSRKTTNYKYFSRITKIEDYLKTHFTEDLPLDEIAAYMGFSSVYFSKYFKKTFGMTFMKYLCTMRLNQAYIDLTTTNLSTLFISEKNGFANYQFFVNKFKETYGCTPSQARKAESQPSTQK